MPVITKRIHLNTKGKTDIIDITEEVLQAVKGSGIKDGIVNVFVSGATAGLTTIEYEPGLVEDIKKAFEKIAPVKGEYAHNVKWGDGNGYSHIRASMLGPSLTVPVEEGVPVLGTWQQIILIDFDNRPRERDVLLKIIGE